MLNKLIKRLRFIADDSVRHIEVNEDDIFDNETDKEEEKRIFSEMANIDGIHEYYKKVMAKDMIRYFNAQLGPQMPEIRGAYKRTLYLKKKMMEEGGETQKKMISKRHL